jgi:hypothetical protein
MNKALADLYDVSLGCIEDVVYGRSRTENARPRGDLAWRIDDLSIPVPFCGCIIWLGAVNEDGYGNIGKTTNRSGMAHIAAWELANGPVPDGLELDHLCRVRSCINVDHLEPVTHEENVRRGDHLTWRLKRRVRRTHCRNGHEATPDTIYWNTEGHLKCRECIRLVNRRQYLKRRKEGYYG